MGCKSPKAIDGLIAKVLTDIEIASSARALSVGVDGSFFFYSELWFRFNADAPRQADYRTERETRLGERFSKGSSLCRAERLPGRPSPAETRKDIS
jgi:hypothetical protein